MDILDQLNYLWENHTGYIFMGGFLLVIGAVAKWRMFVKCDQPGIAAIVPVWDLIVTLRIVGRPASHVWLFLIPVFNIYMVVKLMIELVQSFGKYSALEYALAIVIAPLYFLNLGLAYNEVYYGPVYGMNHEEMVNRAAPSLA
jgi:hypothetical protein